MLGFDAKSPVSSEGGYWIEATMQRFQELFGAETLKAAPVMLPTPEFFPDEGDTPTERVQSFFQRVCEYMQFDPRGCELFLFENEIDDLNASLKNRMPHWRGARAGSNDSFSERTDEGRAVIAVEQKQLADPAILVASLAREVGRNIILDNPYLPADSNETGPLADLMTVFRGTGIFTANAAFNFWQYAGAGRRGWAIRRQGCLSEPMFGYALAYYAKLRGEAKPAWVRHLKPNVAHYFRQSSRFLARRRL